MTKPLGVASVQLNTRMVPCQHCSAYAEERLPGPCIAARSFLIVQADHRSPSTTPNSSWGGKGGPEGVFHPLQAFWVWNRRSAAAPYPATFRVTALTHLPSSVNRLKHPIFYTTKYQSAAEAGRPEGHFSLQAYCKYGRSRRKSHRAVVSRRYSSWDLLFRLV